MIFPMHAQKFVEIGDRFLVDIKLESACAREVFCEWINENNLETVSSEVFKNSGNVEIYRCFLKKKEK